MSVVVVRIRPYLRNVFQEFPEDRSEVTILEGRILYGPRGPTWRAPGHPHPANAMIRSIELNMDKKVEEYLMLRWDGNIGFAYNVANGVVFELDKEAFEFINKVKELTIREFKNRYPNIYNKVFSPS